MAVGGLRHTPYNVVVPLPVLATGADETRDEAWRAQLRDAVRTLAELERALVLTDDERAAVRVLEARGGLPLGITPHFLALIDRRDPADPLRVQVVPRGAEHAPASWDLRDPLGEEEREVVPFLVHRYPDRVLLLATDRCASYCRFCTRKRFVGQGPTPTEGALGAALDYIATHDQIHEVIVSGGDALVLSDDRLAELLSRLRAIPHLDVIRLATRMLAFAPQRVTAALLGVVRMQKHGPATYLLSHFNHPRELAPRAQEAIGALIDAGVPVLNQTVLLRGVNDDRDTLISLCRALTRLRARPYYLHQCDLAPGTEQFRVPLDRARALHASLRGHLSGLSIPTFVVDIPGGLGKVPMNEVPIVAESENDVELRGFRGNTARYPRS